MSIDDLKRELAAIRAPAPAPMSTQERDGSGAGSFMGRLKAQECKDERFIVRTRIIPISIGIVLFAVVMAINPIHNPVMVGGALLIMLTLLVTLVLYVIDYMSICRESFDASVREFLVQKEKRLRSWRSMALRYRIIFALYILGLLMLTLGNTVILRDFTTTQITVYLACIISLLVFFWVRGERAFRKRHAQQHQPLLDMIEELRSEAEERQ
jgi:hypothetical protein